MNTSFNLGRDHLTASKALMIVRNHLKLNIDPATRQKVIACNNAVLKIASKDKAVYGINTGFGSLCSTKISQEDTAELQKNLLLSHSVGVGKLIHIKYSKMMLVLKLHALCQGFSGVSIEIIDRIVWHIEEEIIPAVPEQGSLGASGDLAPLSHLFIPLIGKGQVYERGELKETHEVLNTKGIRPLVLGPKDGLALINGTQFIAAHCIYLLDKFYNNLSHADLISAMMVDALQASINPFKKELHELRAFPANVHVAGRLSTFLKDSEINSAHKNCEKVQDPYSSRCIPQVHGASRNSWNHLKESLEIEINSVTDNPIIFSEEHTISGGNFHGQPLALPIDYACLANSELGSISDRRMYLALEGKSSGVPKLLMSDTGLNSGFMILQYTAAALASENKTHCFPASADSIMTSLGQEDHVSMGSIGVRKALKVAENTEKILAIELVCACQALDFQKPMASGKVIEEIHKHVRSKIPFADKDRLFADDINQAIKILKSGKILELEKQIKDVDYSKYEHIFEIY